MANEPRPQSVPLPTAHAPLLRVGIVLPEDERTRLSLGPTGTIPYTLRIGDQTLPTLGVDESLAIECKDMRCVVHRGSDTFEIPTGANLRIEPTQASALAPGIGLRIDPVTVGRSFHWRKEVALTFPGALEISATKKGLLAVNEIDFEDYCTCVITSEMSPECPSAFAFAQATAARSWSYVFLRNKHPDSGFDVCNDDDCQRYQGTSFLTNEAVAAVRTSRGMYLKNPEGNTFAAYYAKGCGGHSEESLNSFGFGVPGISAQPDSVKQPNERRRVDLRDERQFSEWLHSPFTEACCSPHWIPECELPRYLGAVDKPGSYFRWTHEISRAEISAIVRERFSLPDLDQVLRLQHGKRGVSGRILTLTLHYLTATGEQKTFELQRQYDIRRALHPSFLFSSAFVHEWVSSDNRAEDTLKISGAGWGHGVGLCQIGALGLALKGYSGEAILAHYFPLCELVRCYE